MERLFTASIRMPNGRTLQFRFTHFYTLHGERYFVTTIDKNLKVLSFFMTIKERAWQLDNSENHLADWILQMEEQLAREIMNRNRIGVDK